jgi:hypothetical protein
MPNLTPEQLANLRTNVQEAIMAANPDLALERLKEALPEGRAKHDQALLLISRQSDIVLHTVNNTLSEEQLEVMRNNLTADILLFINHLTTADFGPKPAQRPSLKPGHLLYQVPAVMVLQTTYDCLVRVAEELSQVMEGIAKDEDVVIEDIGLSEVMEVEILDGGGSDDPAFDIMLLSDGEQLVDEYSYTEWVFNVRPLREGQHQLILKISVLLTINGKERTKNVILRRPISVSAKAPKNTLPATLQRVLPLKTVAPSLVEEIVDNDRIIPPSKPISTAGADGGSTRPLPAPVPTRQPDIRRKSQRGSLASLTATLLFLVFAGLWLVKSDGFEKLLPGDKPDVGTEKSDTIKDSSIIIDSLKASKSLPSDTLRND